MRFTTAWPVLICILLSGCAYIGEPLPPALKIPIAAIDLSAVQRGDKIHISFTTPEVTMEGLPIDPPPPADIRIGLSEPPDTPASKEIDIRPWVGKEVVIGVIFHGPKGRVSEWSNFAHLKVIEAIGQPAQLKAESLVNGVQLQWSGPAVKYRVFRNEVLLDTVDKTSYLDTRASFGQKYTYQIQGFQDAAESELSTEVSLTPEDIFPPEPPLSPVGLAGVKSIELSWDASTAQDVAFYRVYRNGQNGLTKTIFSDPDVVSDQKYSYTITAVDAKMNESAASAPVEIIFP